MCSFSVNYDKTVFYTDSRSPPSGGSRARNGYGWGYARGVRCDARVRRGLEPPAGRSAARDIDDEKKKFLSLNSVLTRIDQRVTAASGSILTVGRSGGQSAERAGGQSRGAGGEPYSCDTAPNEDDGDGDVE
ncbi:hypothetical protein EVAR_83540_1 [Eumeta japonica]|uniref:Uncharacterized protein n=1 Tax=Eumeta variegata TaxID=151549 RepID=A0A4C2A6U1_EUMVA|nr:hypothetical protein EVAR_83540_1 [Eumeta japonica]